MLLDQVRKLQAELDERHRTAAADRERAKAGLSSLAGNMGRHCEKLQTDAASALEGLQALVGRLTLVAGAASGARQLEAEL